jgi:hypothetical protein
MSTLSSLPPDPDRVDEIAARTESAMNRVRRLSTLSAIIPVGVATILFVLATGGASIYQQKWLRARDSIDLMSSLIERRRARIADTSESALADAAPLDTLPAAIDSTPVIVPQPRPETPIETPIETPSTTVPPTSRPPTSRPPPTRPTAQFDRRLVDTLPAMSTSLGRLIAQVSAEQRKARGAALARMSVPLTRREPDSVRVARLRAELARVDTIGQRRIATAVGNLTNASRRAADAIPR